MPAYIVHVPVWLYVCLPASCWRHNVEQQQQGLVQMQQCIQRSHSYKQSLLQSAFRL
jgi:hypothetical protein